MYQTIGPRTWGSQKIFCICKTFQMNLYMGPDNISSCTASVEAESFGQKVSASVKAETHAQNIKYEIKFRLIEGANLRSDQWSQKEKYFSTPDQRKRFMCTLKQ